MVGSESDACILTRSCPAVSQIRNLCSSFWYCTVLVMKDALVKRNTMHCRFKTNNKTDTKTYKFSSDSDFCLHNKLSSSNKSNNPNVQTFIKADFHHINLRRLRTGFFLKVWQKKKKNQHLVSIIKLYLIFSNKTSITTCLLKFYKNKCVEQLFVSGISDFSFLFFNLLSKITTNSCHIVSKKIKLFGPKRISKLIYLTFENLNTRTASYNC